jgi:hypothetical protein
MLFKESMEQYFIMDKPLQARVIHALVKMLEIKKKEGFYQEQSNKSYIDAK